MVRELKRREFLQATAAGSALCLGAAPILAAGASSNRPIIVSPGCRRSKVRVAKIYLGIPGALWPSPKVDLNDDVASYEREFSWKSKELSDVDFVVDELITSTDQVRKVKDKLKDVDGVLVIHLSMGVMGMLREILSVGKPTVLFAVPYSGHEWTQFGSLMKTEQGALLDCMLTTDYDQLAVAIRTFRAIHHLREAKILNLTKRSLTTDFVKGIKEKFGTEVKKLDLEQVLEAYNAVPDAEAKAEAKRWIAQAEEVVEPSEEEIVKSCKLALAFEKMLDDEDATVFTMDCYGTMFDRVEGLLLPAYPCIGFTRLNNMGLGGICESDLRSAMMHILYQGLSGKPGFISDPTMDVSRNSIILAHCLGTTRMDGPDEEPAPYRLRTIMERREGAVPQVRMRIGQKVTQAELIRPDLLVYFTGEIIDTPDSPRGCRTKITVKVDGDAEKLWQNWTNGLHRVTCYGDLTQDLRRFCRFKAIEMVDEA